MAISWHKIDQMPLLGKNIKLREVFNLFSFDSVLQTESKENKLKTSLIEIIRLLFNHPIHEINNIKLALLGHFSSNFDVFFLLKCSLFEDKSNGDNN